MKLSLRLSLLGNVILFAGAAFLIAEQKRQRATFKFLDAQSSQAAFAVGEPARPQAISGQTKPFSWSQLESSDYRVYLANLRAIGCPEQTIGDIIRADIHSLYLAKRNELKLDETASSGPWSLAEETRLVSSLLGAPPAREMRADAAASGAPPTLPLVLREVDATVLHLDPEQAEAVAEVRNDFINDIGGTNQDSSDPAYAARWQKAQPVSDRMLRGLIGQSAFMRYQNESQ